MRREEQACACGEINATSVTHRQPPQSHTASLATHSLHSHKDSLLTHTQTPSPAMPQPRRLVDHVYHITFCKEQREVLLPGYCQQ